MLVEIVLGVVAAVVLLWLLFLVALAVTKPDTDTLKASLRLVPDVARLSGRLARDRRVPRWARGLLWLLVGYLALPIDLVPDFVPVLGYADDAIVVAVVLRIVIASAGIDVVRERWPGTDVGLSTVARLCRLPLD